MPALTVAAFAVLSLFFVTFALIIVSDANTESISRVYY